MAANALIPVLLQLGDKLLSALVARAREGLRDTWIDRALAATQ